MEFGDNSKRFKRNCGSDIDASLIQKILDDLERFNGRPTVSDDSTVIIRVRMFHCIERLPGIPSSDSRMEDVSAARADLRNSQLV